MIRLGTSPGPGTAGWRRSGPVRPTAAIGKGRTFAKNPEKSGEPAYYLGLYLGDRAQVYYPFIRVPETERG